MHAAKIAYFSMEIALESGMKTYSGGLGVLAGDTLRAAADMNVPVVAVTLAHRQGYVLQRLDADAHQQELADRSPRRSHAEGPDDGARDAEELYEKLEQTILPLYYQRPDDYVDVMRSAIALTGSFFNTHRMLHQYIAHAYLD